MKKSERMGLGKRTFRTSHTDTRIRPTVFKVMSFGHYRLPSATVGHRRLPSATVDGNFGRWAIGRRSFRCVNDESSLVEQSIIIFTRLSRRHISFVLRCLVVRISENTLWKDPTNGYARTANGPDNVPFASG